MDKQTSEFPNQNNDHQMIFPNKNIVGLASKFSQFIIMKINIKDMIKFNCHHMMFVHKIK